MTPLKVISSLARTSLRLGKNQRFSFLQQPFFPFSSMAAAAAPISTVTPSVSDLEVAKKFLAFNDGCSSVFHATHEAQKMVEAAGFQKLKESDEWDLKPGGKYFVTRNQSALVAFIVGGKFQKGNGMSVIGSHTDSPCLKVKPISKQTHDGYLQVGVETYGGGLWHTWFDRDLSVAGRVILKTDFGFSTRLVKVHRPICRISNVAIHLSSGEERAAFAVNKEAHLAPILATAAADELNTPVRPAGKVTAPGGPNADSMHHSALLEVLAQELSVAPEAIVDLELALYDTQPCAIGGVYQEFIFAPRLDNLGSCFGGLSAISAIAGDAAAVADAEHVLAIALFDHEEVGSGSASGACGTLMATLVSALNEGDAVAIRRSARQSLMVSADMAHAVHPNYPQKHEQNHRPIINAGCVVKHNTNQRYATNLVTTHMFKQFATEAGVPLQHFVIKQDMGCGSTIGPTLAAALGMPTVDVGLPQLSMHSIRETCGVSDMASSVTLYDFALRRQPAVYAALENQDTIEQ